MRLTILVAALSACTSQPTAPVQTAVLGADFAMAPGQTVEIPNAGLSLTFMRVLSDGRCPVDPRVQCVWEGTAQLEFRARSGDTLRDLQIETHRRANTVVVGLYVIEVTRLTPDTVGEPIPADRYRATVRVVRAN